MDRNALLDQDRRAYEPVDLIGQIKSYGLLFSLSEPDLIVRQVSPNVGNVLGMSVRLSWNVRSRPSFGPRQFEVFKMRLQTDDLTSASALGVKLDNRALEKNCVAHRYDGVLIVKLEPVNAAQARVIRACRKTADLTYAHKTRVG